MSDYGDPYGTFRVPAARPGGAYGGGLDEAYQQQRPGPNGARWGAPGPDGPYGGGPETGYRPHGASGPGGPYGGGPWTAYQQQGGPGPGGAYGAGSGRGYQEQGPPVHDPRWSEDERPPRYVDPREARAAARAEQARAKALRPWYLKKRWYFVGFAVVLVMIAAVAGGGGGENDSGGRGGDEPAAGAGTGTEGGQEVFAVGQTAHTGDFDVTVHGVTDPFTPANQFDVQPRPGFRFVAIELTMTNTSDEPQPVSMLLGAELTDHLDRLSTYSIAGGELPRLDAATAAPGEARRGWVVFEVPADAQALQLRVQGNITATGSLFQVT